MEDMKKILTLGNAVCAARALAALFQLVESLPEREPDTVPSAEIICERNEVLPVLLAHPAESGFAVTETVRGAGGMWVHMGLQNQPSKLTSPPPSAPDLKG